MNKTPGTFLLLCSLLVFGLILGCDSSPEVTDSSGTDSGGSSKVVTPKKTRVPYLQRRAEFETELTTKGAAPGNQSAPAPPPGVELVTYPSGNPNIRLNAWVRKPLSLVSEGHRKKYPGLVYFHGGFALAPGDMEACRMFTDAGFVVMTPTLRGENGNPGYFELFMAELDDAASAVRWLSQQPYVDKDQVYAFGHSAGGGISALLSLMDGIPLKHCGSAGGLYDSSIFERWGDTVPFDATRRDEVELRLLLGNLRDMKRSHYAYIGIDDAAFDKAIALAQAEMEKLGWETGFTPAASEDDGQDDVSGDAPNGGAAGGHGEGGGGDDSAPGARQSSERSGGHGEGAAGSGGHGESASGGNRRRGDSGRSGHGEAPSGGNRRRQRDSGRGGHGEGPSGRSGHGEARSAIPDAQPGERQYVSYQPPQGHRESPPRGRTPRGRRGSDADSRDAGPSGHGESGSTDYFDDDSSDGQDADDDRDGGGGGGHGEGGGSTSANSSGSEADEQSDEVRLFLVRVPGDHLESLQPALEDYLRVIQSQRASRLALRSGGDGYGNGSRQEAQSTGLPANLADWTSEEFRKAARMSHPRLVEAVDRLVSSAPGDPRVAQLLTELLLAVGEESSGAGGRDPRSAQAAQTVIRAIIKALINNGTSEAWQTINHLVSGQITTVLQDDVTVELALTTCIESCQGAGHPAGTVLEKALNSPEQLQPGRGDRLREIALRAVASVAASVMDHAMQVPAQPAEGSSWAQEAGYGDGYGTEQPDGQRYPQFGDQGGDDNSGVAVEVPEFNVNVHSLEADEARRATQFIWRPEIAGLFQQRLQNLESLSDSAGVLAVSGSLPMASMRAATYGALFDHWQDGAETLLSSGIYTNVVRDPGTLLVLKSLPRVQPQEPSKRPRRNPSGRPSKAFLESQARMSWWEASASFVQVLTKRLQAAAEERGSSSVDAEGLSLRLHENAQPQATFRFQWPADAAAEVGDAGVDRLSVHYVRMVETGQPQPIFVHYKRQLRRAEEYRSQSVVWLDQISSGSEPNLRRSTDVFFKPLGGLNEAGAQDNDGGGQNPQGEVQRFSIEILVVEAANPRIRRTAAK